MASRTHPGSTDIFQTNWCEFLMNAAFRLSACLVHFENHDIENSLVAVLPELLSCRLQTQFVTTNGIDGTSAEVEVRSL